ncbi:PH domain-containing protein [Aphelenchoides bicaudatus]|nr:PH domain-containing protein [Aphelenchoides bicaudatus]
MLAVDNASVSSSSMTHSTDLSEGSTSSSSNLTSTKCNLGAGFIADTLYTCVANPKKLKKLNFVICSDRSLEIYDSEKAYRKKKRSKYIVDLANIYSVTKRVNDKIRLCVMLVTPEQTFYLRATTDISTHDWHAFLSSAMHTARSLSQGRQVNHHDFPENTWDVTVLAKNKFYKNTDAPMSNLCVKEKRASGRKRLCFFSHALVLLQMHTEPTNITSKIEQDPDLQEPDLYFYFPRPFISFYGCQDKYFFLKTSTSVYGTCEIIMECENATTSGEIFKQFEDSAKKNTIAEEECWQTLINDDANGNDEQEDEYYNPRKGKSGDPSSSEKNAMGVLAQATSYCIETPNSTKKGKEVRFKTEDHHDLHPIENVPQEATIADGEVGKKIAADIFRRNSNKALENKKELGILSGLFAALKKRFYEKNKLNKHILEEFDEEVLMKALEYAQQNVKDPFSDICFWAEKRVSVIEEENEENSGGTLKIDEAAQDSVKIPVLPPIEEQQRIKRDLLLTTALREYNRQMLAKRKRAMLAAQLGHESIEMSVLSSPSTTDESICCTSTESSSCEHSLNESDPEQKLNEKITSLDSTSSSSANDSCISNTSEDFSNESSVSNIEYTWKPINRFVNAKKFSLDSRSCNGNFTCSQSQTNDDNLSNLSNDSCYSSLSNQGYQQIPKSQSLSQLGCESPSEPLKKPTSDKLDNVRKFEHQSLQKYDLPDDVIKPLLRSNKSQNDLASHFEQNVLQSTIVKAGDLQSLASSIRQRAASLGNKSWLVNPLGQSLRRHRHRQDCKKRKNNSSNNNSLNEDQPLLDTRHSSISSDNSCTHRDNDLSELNFAQESNSIGSTASMNSNDSADREGFIAFGNTNRNLIPTTRYSNSSNASSRRLAKARKNQKGYELDVVECFLNPEDFDKMKTQQAESTSSRSSGDDVSDVPRCKHGKPKRHKPRSNHSQDSEEHPHNCRRKQRSSCQDAIAEEDTDNSRQRETISSIESQTLTESDRMDEQSLVHSDTSSQKSETNSAELTALDMVNNNPNPVTIVA